MVGALMERRSQGPTEYLILLAAVLILVAAITYTISLSSAELGSNVSGQIDNVRDNIIVPGLVGMLLG